MNFSSSLNQILDYIDTHLSQEIDYSVLSRFLGVNTYTMERVFSLFCNITITEYIRKRRLSVAFFDLFYGHEKIIDVALKYNYENPTSFSRAFQKFHGIKPSEVKKGNGNYRNFPKLHFEEDTIQIGNLEYYIQTLPEFTLYGKGKKTTDDKISLDAPAFFAYMQEKFQVYEYGMVVYENRFFSDNYEYWVLTKTFRSDLDAYVIPKSKWLTFRIDSTNAQDIQKLSHQFYYTFLPKNQFNLRELPELEVYHEGYMEFLIPIE